MNCSQCRERLAAHLEGLADRADASRIESHLADCPACRAELDQLEQLVGQLADHASSASADSLDAHVMHRIIREQALQIRRLQMRRRFRLFAMGGTAATAAVLFVLAVFWPSRSDNTVQAAEVLAKAAEAASDLRSVHIRGRIRTVAHENFEVVFPDRDFVPVEVWRQFGKEPKWRVEKPQRVAVTDGASAVMLVNVVNSQIAFKGPPHSPFDAGWLLRMADVGDVITEELRVALAEGGDLNLAARRQGPDGKQKLVVTIDAKAPKDVADHLKKIVITLSDHRRVYQFDAQTRRLEDVKIYMRRDDRDVLVFEATEIEYDPEIDPSTFTLEIPEDALWYEEPKRLPDNEKYERMRPDEIARALLEACAKEDWEEAQKHWGAPITEPLKKYLAGLEIIRIGEPFESGTGAWAVPYEIRIANGYVKKLNLYLRKHPSAGRYIAVGGI
ncbi:MAG: zf-HC2 domain-containing protein [Planctomycetota bacterium]|jgi:hypothetical protein